MSTEAVSMAEEIVPYLYIVLFWIDPMPKAEHLIDKGAGS
jgi:hypothetical protein